MIDIPHFLKGSSKKNLTIFIMVLNDLIPVQNTAVHRSSSLYGFTRGADYYDAIQPTGDAAESHGNALKAQFAASQFQIMSFENRIGLTVDTK